MPIAIVTLTPAAEADLDDIWLHIALDNPRAADRLVDSIKARFDQLATFPQSGQARPEIDPDARSLNEGHYLIVYRLLGPNVEIVRIVHGARNLTEIY